MYETRGQMIRNMAGPLACGPITLILGLLFLWQFVHKGYVDTGRWGVFIPARGIHAVIIIFLLVFFGVLCLLYCGYLFACLVAFSIRGDFDEPAEIRKLTDNRTAPWSLVFTLMVIMSILITIPFLMILKGHV